MRQCSFAKVTDEFADVRQGMHRDRDGLLLWCMMLAFAATHDWLSKQHSPCKSLPEELIIRQLRTCCAVSNT